MHKTQACVTSTSFKHTMSSDESEDDDLFASEADPVAPPPAPDAPAAEVASDLEWNDIGPVDEFPNGSSK